MAKTLVNFIGFETGTSFDGAETTLNPGTPTSRLGTAMTIETSPTPPHSEETHILKCIQSKTQAFYTTPKFTPTGKMMMGVIIQFDRIPSASIPNIDFLDIRLTRKYLNVY